MRRAPASVSGEVEREIKKFTLARMRDSDALAAFQDPIYKTGQAPTTRGERTTVAGVAHSTTRRDVPKLAARIFIDAREPHR